MKLTKTRLKQLIREAIEEEPGITISPGHGPQRVPSEPTADPVEDIIDEYSGRSAKPELIRRMLEAIRDFGDNLPLDENDLNLIDEASEKMKPHLESEEEYDMLPRPTEDPMGREDRGGRTSQLRKKYMHKKPEWHR